MTRHVELWGFDEQGGPLCKAVYVLRPDGTIGVESHSEGLRQYAISLVEDGVTTPEGTFYLQDGRAFLDNLKHHFHGRYTWVKEVSDS
jgi:hypothetical protein